MSELLLKPIMVVFLMLMSFLSGQADAAGDNEPPSAVVISGDVLIDDREHHLWDEYPLAEISEEIREVLLELEELGRKPGEKRAFIGILLDDDKDDRAAGRLYGELQRRCGNRSLRRDSGRLDVHFIEQCLLEERGLGQRKYIGGQAPDTAGGGQGHGHSDSLEVRRRHVKESVMAGIGEYHDFGAQPHLHQGKGRGRQGPQIRGLPYPANPGRRDFER